MFGMYSIITNSDERQVPKSVILGFVDNGMLSKEQYKILNSTGEVRFNQIIIRYNEGDVE